MRPFVYPEYEKPQKASKKIEIHAYSFKRLFAFAHTQNRDYIKNFKGEDLRQVCSHACKSMNYRSTIKWKLIERLSSPEIQKKDYNTSQMHESISQMHRFIKTV